MQGEPLADHRRRSASGDARRLLPRRRVADRACPRARNCGEPETARQCAGLCRRCDGGECQPVVPARRRIGPQGRADLSVSRRPQPRCRGRVSADGEALARRLSALRSRERRPPEGSARRGGGLRRWRLPGARRLWREEGWRGRVAGLRLEELGRADLLDLLRECRAEDEESARLVEAYLDRAHPDWQEDIAGARTGAPPPTGSSADVTVEEAYAILGLAAGATVQQIRDAHRRLMKQLHPDHGGTDYLATKINRARDVLLNR